MKAPFTRRTFFGTATASAAAATIPSDKPALLGGKPVREPGYHPWPVIQKNDEDAWMEVLRGRKWNRRSGSNVERFEREWAKALKARYCLAVANGTSALITSLYALGVGPGDEVIVPPYTFVATVNAVLVHHALPVFVDIDPDTFQIDAARIDAAITPNTRCLLPVHIAGSPADLDTILKTAKTRNLPVLEDACQAHFGEWRGKKLSTVGDLGCFSFQASKNLNCGEGGAILTNNESLIQACRSFHDNGRGSRGYATNGCNLRMTEFQGALLLTQLTRLEEQALARESNAAYLTKMLRQIPGIEPARVYAACTRSAYHLYMLRYDAAKFSGLPRAKFLKALNAEGVGASGGYRPLNREPFIQSTLRSRAFQRIYSRKDLEAWAERNHCPQNDRLCEEAVWLPQTSLLGPRAGMEPIAEAVRKIQKHASELARHRG